MSDIKVYNTDCMEAMREVEENSVDSIVTDPPYGLGFMGKKWDELPPGQEVFEECLRVLKPGGHLLCFGGSRTYHRMAVAVEDAGFEIRDQLMWVYGSGFPKNYDISKNLDKYLKTGNAQWNGTGDSSKGPLGYAKLQHKQGHRPNDYSNAHQNKEDISEEKAQAWEGYGTALKPAHEPIVLARKPLEKGLNTAQNCLKWGTGAINIDGCRVSTEENLSGGMVSKGRPWSSEGWDRPWMHDEEKTEEKKKESAEKVEKANNMGRHPANLIHDGSDEVEEGFPDTSGSTSRFFYCAKATKKERGEYNDHPTVKPISLMSHLVKLVTPEGGTCMDPFCGSGTTGLACKALDRKAVLIDADKKSTDIAQRRIDEYEGKGSGSPGEQLALFD